MLIVEGFQAKKKSLGRDFFFFLRNGRLEREQSIQCSNLESMEQILLLDTHSSQSVSAQYLCPTQSISALT